MRIWLAVDRNRNKIIDFEIGDGSWQTGTKLWQKVKQIAGKIKWVCTDDYDAYKKVQIAEKHVITKAETSFVEAKNSSVRDNLARFNRRTKRYSKSEEMLRLSISLFLKKENFEEYL